MQYKQSGQAIYDRLGVALLRPAEAITPSKWAAANLIVPDGPRAGEKWDPRLTPYIIEPLDSMGPDAPINKAAIRKSAQTGFTVMAIAVVGHAIDCDPAGGILLVQPTDGALADFIRDKLNPAIENTPALKAKVKPQDIPGIGWRMNQRLMARGVHTIEQLLALNVEQMRTLWGGIAGERIWLWLRGTDFTVPKSTHKSVGHAL